MKVNSKLRGAFTLIELLIVIAIIGILASASMPAFNSIRERGNRTKDLSNIKQILLACRAFAVDYDGLFPSYSTDVDSSEEGSKFSTSTEAFNELIPDYMDTEGIFWFQTKHPDKMFPPTEDGELEAKENVYAYVTGQNDTGYSRSPLVADGLMDSPGTYGEYHPWLKSKRAIIGYVGGHAQEEVLTEAKAGATVRSKDGRTRDIFAQREEGSAGGGWLDVPTDNILLPD